MFSLADAILTEDIGNVRALLRYGQNINQLDEYGFTPLIEAAIVDNITISQLLLENGALPNVKDVTGGTPLHWAAENNNTKLVKLLIENSADPNAYNLAGQPVLVMPMLRQQLALSRSLIKSGADQLFAHDYINTKLLGHLFELVGTATIVDPKNNFVEVDFEGFYLEVTVGLIADSLNKFQNHFAARQLRRYSGLSKFIIEAMQRAEQLIKYQQYRVDIKKVRSKIHSMLRQDPLIIPVGYEGHAITFIRYGDIWVKCDRREDSRLYDNVMFYRVRRMENLNVEFLNMLIYEKQDSDFINHDLDKILDLEPITELKVEAQVSGNCSWANVEATIPALFFLVLIQLNPDPTAFASYKKIALDYFHRWRDWNKDRSLQFCIQRFETSDAIRKASHAETLAAILFQRCDYQGQKDRERIDRIMQLLINSPYSYLLTNYLRVYYYEGNTEEGKRFFELLKDSGFIKS